MNIALLPLVASLVACGGGSSSSTPSIPTVTPKEVVQEFKVQDDTDGFGGSQVLLQDGSIVFTSHTNPDCTVPWRCRRVELHTDVTLPIEVSYKFRIDRFVDIEDEPACKSTLGCYVIISQFWNSKAAPRAYLTLRRKPLGDGTLSQIEYNLYLENKDDDGRVTTYHTFTILPNVFNEVLVNNTGDSFYACVNDECSDLIVTDTSGEGVEQFKFGMYWQSQIYKGLDTINLDKHIILTFKDITL